MITLLATYNDITTYNDEAGEDVDNDKPNDTDLDVNEKCSWIEEIINRVVIIRDLPDDQHGNLYFSPNEKNF